MHVNGTWVVFWVSCDQVWLFLTLLANAAEVELVLCMSMGLRWCFGHLVTNYGSL